MKMRLTSFLVLFYLSAESQIVRAFGETKEIKNGLKGTVFPFELPESYTPKTRGFSKNGHDKLVPLTTLYTRCLDVKDQDMSAYLPGVPIEYSIETRNFCIVYEGHTCVSEDDTYTIKINSDDGNIVWIDDKEVINNDAFSKMSITDTVSLKLNQGSHKVKIWYFQGFAPNMGLQVFMKKTSEKKYKLMDFLCEAFEKEEKISLPSSILFAVGKYTLKPESLTAIKDLTEKIKTEGYTKIILDGYTDDKGSNEVNNKLSYNRANTIMNELKKQLATASISFEVFGHGPNNPIGDNSTEIGREENRRVEIRLVK